MLRVKPSPEVVANLIEIDAARAAIAAAPTPPPETLERLEKEFILETVYYANKLDGSRLSKADTKRVLEQAE